jgi:LmbE family N-acetylglucosaminyl deacetylase
VIELVVAPHPDDEAIGCGGIIAQNSVAGVRTVVLFLSSGESGLPGTSMDAAAQVREQEATAAAEILGICDLHFLRLPDGHIEENAAAAAESVAAVLRRERPEIVRLPHPQDGHADHHAAWPVLRQAMEIADIPIPEFLAYEIWTPMVRPDYAEDITEFMDRKLDAIGCYSSQLRQLPYDQGIAGLNAYRGAFLAGSRYAEAVSHLWLSD